MSKGLLVLKNAWVRQTDFANDFVSGVDKAASSESEDVARRELEESFDNGVVDGKDWRRAVVQPEWAPTENQFSRAKAELFGIVQR